MYQMLKTTKLEDSKLRFTQNKNTLSIKGKICAFLQEEGKYINGIGLVFKLSGLVFFFFGQSF